MGPSLFTKTSSPIQLPESSSNGCKEYLIDTPARFDPPRLARYVRVEAYNDLKISVNDITIWGAHTPSVGRCPNDCSGHGSCGTGTSKPACSCSGGHTGSDCSVAPCLGGCGAHGSCMDGICECEQGVYGSACGHDAPCPNKCWGHGACERGRCVASSGYGGLDSRYMYLNTTSLVVETGPVGQQLLVAASSAHTSNAVPLLDLSVRPGRAAATATATAPTAPVSSRRLPFWHD